MRTRDTSCRWPGCDETRYLDGHHGVHWSHLGPTKLANLVHLCWHHHFLVHAGGWTLDIRPDGSLRICDPNGRALGGPPAYVIGADDPGVTERNQARGITIDDMTGIPRGYGDSLDLDHVITGLLYLRDPGFATHELAAACRPVDA